MTKKRSFLLIVFSLIALFIFCKFFGFDNSNSVNASFEDFTQEVFAQEVSSNTITLHYTVQDPKSFDLTVPEASLGSYETDNVNSCAALENCLSALASFPYEKLSKDNQLTYDLLSASLHNSLNMAPYVLYEEPLSPMTGMQAQLPVLFSEYQFHSSSDIDTYLDLLADMPRYVESLIDFEKLKSESGLFMASYTADAIIKECDSFVLMGGTNYLYSTFEQRIDAMSDLTTDAKEAYIEENARLIQECVFPAYKELSAALTSLRTTGVNPNGLCHLPNGTAYYEKLVAIETGSSRSILELQKLTQQQMMEDLSVMQDILTTGSATSEASALVLADSNPAAILNDLKGKLNGQFPVPANVSTQIKYIEKSMEEFLSPAFYMVPAIDHTGDNVIYINAGHIPDDLDLYTTLAHEGYPGHLYQTTYFAATNPSPLRSILDFGGYTEGWATYSEMLSYYYTPLDKNIATLLQRNASVLLGLYALADIGIHYDGWTLVDAVSFFHQYGITDTETIEDIYDLIVADPANYLKYYIGYVEFLELKRDAMNAWGDDFTQLRFHQEILDLGPAPFDILRAQLDA